MNRYTVNDVEWRIDDEGLREIVKDLSPQDGSRRDHMMVPYGEKKVFIKSFKEKGISGWVRNRVLPRGKKEYLLGRRLLSFSIPTPKPLGYGISPAGSYIIQEWVEGESLSQILKKEGRQGHLTRLAGLLKTLKTHHIRHNDLHLDNILVTEDGLLLIDLHKMQIKRSFGKSDEVSNLSHALVSLYHDMNEDEKESFFAVYGSHQVKDLTETEIGRLTLRWFNKKKQRAFEGSSMITAQGNRLYAAGMEEIARGGLVETIKQDKKVRVERYADHIRKVYRDTRRLKKAWKAHVVFLYMNLPAVPTTYYCALPASGEPGYIAMEDLKGRGEELDRFLDRHYDSMTYGERKSFIDGLATFFDGLLKWGIMHHDLKGCNLFVLEKRDFTLLDVEDFTFGKLDMESVTKMFLQLNTTLPKRISMRDRMRFFIRITSSLRMDKGALFRTLLWKSAGKEIVYEGVSGLMKESW